MAVSRAIGALFLGGFLTYGIGFALVTSALDGPGKPGAVLGAGALLMLLNVLVDVGKGVLFFEVLEQHGRRTAMVYLTMMAIEGLLLGIGVACLLVAGNVHARGGDPALLLDGNNVLYQIGEFLLGFAGVFLCGLLVRARLVPRGLGWWGAAGYVVFSAGTIAELLGLPIGDISGSPRSSADRTLYGSLPARRFARVPSQGAARPVPLVDERVLVDQPR